MWDRYRELRKEERCIIRQKKREVEIRECEEFEMLVNRDSARKFYQKVRRLTEGFKTGAFSYKNKDGDLGTDVQSILKLWREHFSNLLNSDSYACHRECEDPDSPIVDDGIDVPLPDHDEVRIAITRLKNNKAAGADGLPAELFELFKYGGEELVRCMHQLLCKIWSDENMPVCSGTIFYKSVQLLVCADDIDIIGLNNRGVSSAFCKLDKEAKRMGLVVNEDKAKYLLSSNKQSAHLRVGTHATVDSYEFGVVKEFVYLGTSINTDKNDSLKSNVESLLPTSATLD